MFTAGYSIRLRYTIYYYYSYKNKIFYSPTKLSLSSEIWNIRLISKYVISVFVRTGLNSFDERETLEHRVFPWHIFDNINTSSTYFISWYYWDSYDECENKHDNSMKSHVVAAHHPSDSPWLWTCVLYGGVAPDVIVENLWVITEWTTP